MGTQTEVVLAHGEGKMLSPHPITLDLFRHSQADQEVITE